MAIIVVITWAVWLRVQHPDYISVPSLLVNTVSVMVAFIPEGLPVCVTLALLLIAKRMAKSNVLVKELSTIETLSCVNVIASDKTGTLTQNKMFVAKSAVGLDTIDLDEMKNIEIERSIGFNQLVACSSLCNNASFDETDKMTPINNRKAKGDATDIALLKFSTEYQKFPNINESYKILSEIPFNSKNKWMMKIVRPINPLTELKNKKRDRRESVNSVSASLSSPIGMDAHKVIFRNDEEQDLMLLKGAPDYLLKKCRRILDENGEEKHLTNQHIADLIKLQNDWCILGQRVLLICKKSIDFAELENSATSLTMSDIESLVHKTNDFCIVGLVGIIDPPREGIADVIAKCRTAGIRVFMVTGDYALTAAAIALQIGIFTGNQYDTAESMRIKHKEHHETYEKSALLLTGTDLENFTQEDWRLVTPYSEIVFARTTPEQKLKTVKEFQSDGYVVGVTGDGVNDAPALKCADIGIAMGGGSEVAMEAAQLVLLDNNFSSILVAIKNGRLVFANLRKVILYLIPGGCFAELVPVLMSIFIGVPQDIASFQMLIISLFTDIAPSLSLIMEKPEKDLLTQPPRSKKDHIVDWKFLLQAYGILGTMIVLFSQCMFFWYIQWYAGLPPNQVLLSFDLLTNSNVTLYNSNQTGSYVESYFTGQSVTFISIVYLQIFGNLLSTRTSFRSFFDHSPWKKKSRNLYLFGAQFISIAIMIFVLFFPYFGSIFNVRAPPTQFFFMPLAFAAIVFGVDEVRKLLVRRKLLGFHKFGW
jgi:sodium/potassium-transporting ATPase subunit alpha